MKQYTISVFSQASENFKMQIIAHENILFSELHQGIQTALEYDSLQMASFFMSNNDWTKEEEIALIDMEDKGEVLLMNNYKISDLILAKGQNLIYLFDFFSERSFLMTVDKIEESQDSIFSIDVTGEIPPQINIDNENIEDLMLDDDTEALDKEFDDEYNDIIGDESFENIDDLEDY